MNVLREIRLPKLIPLGLILIIIFRLAIQKVLYSSGFTALTADEFGRTVLAAQWAKEPFALWSGAWLPFHTYLMGLALKVFWELVIVPRAITIVIGLTTICLMYLFSKELFDRREIALIAAFLLATNPAHIWLSSTPLTEIIHTLLILASMLSFISFIKKSKISSLYSSSLLLGIANGFRYEAWMISLVFSLYLLVTFLHGYLRKRTIMLGWHTIVAACLPWLFPIAWLIGNYVITGDPLSGPRTVKLFRIARTGDVKSYISYWRTFLHLDPFTTFLVVPAFIILFLEKFRSKQFIWYTIITGIPLLLFFLVHGGLLEPPGNFIRYQAPFLFMFYPLMACGLYILVTKWVTNQKVQLLILVGLLGIIGWRQISTAFQYTNDPAGIGLEVGKTLRLIRETDQSSQPKPAMIETLLWEYLAVHVGSNDVSAIFYDRELAFSNPIQTSWMAKPDSLVGCIEQYGLAYLVAKAPEIKQNIQETLQIDSMAETNGYSIYEISRIQVPPMYAGQTGCR